MAVAAAHGERDCALPQPAGLALHAGELLATLEDEVAAGVLAERQIDAVPELAQHRDDRKRRAVTDVLWVLHVAKVADAAAGPCPGWTARRSPTMKWLPE